MSTQDEKGLELKVGIFICIGLAVIATMVIKFGLGGEGFKKTYLLQVDLPNASGLLKDSDVLLAGAKIGTVGDKPLLSGNLGTVRVTVKIYEEIKVPKNSVFSVGSSGLLGDKFVEVETPPKFDPSKFDPADQNQIYTEKDPPILGVKAGGLDALTAKGADVMDHLNDEIKLLKELTAKIDTGVLGEDSIKNLQDTFANLKATTGNFVEVSKNASKVVTDAQSAVDTTKQTMTTVNGAAGDLRKVLDGAKTILSKANEGDGLIATLLTNRELSENLKALVINLREHGVLFYKNPTKTETPAPSPAPRKRAAH
jgi:phospholipid/cholesterol/gamma-HCH transport system substrate-binding protein